MSTYLLLQNIARYIRLKPDEESFFLSVLSSRTFKRKETLLREGEVANHTAHVVSGCLRAYATSKDGVEHVLSFAPAGWWISDMQSHITGKPGVLTIEALEPTEALLISRDAREELFARIPSFERYFRILIER